MVKHFKRVDKRFGKMNKQHEVDLIRQFEELTGFNAKDYSP